MNALSKLAEAHGIARSYHDIFGTLRKASDATLRALLAAMGVDASSDERAAAAMSARDEATWRAKLPALVVFRHDRSPWYLRLRLPDTFDGASIRARVVTETGEARDVTLRRAAPAGEAVVDGTRWLAHDLALEADLPLGYHRLAILSHDETVAQTTCAVSPPTCYRPEALRDGGRAFGFALQLYALRSRRNWGIGDFTDLAHATEALGAQGADIVGVNPLHALFAHDPSRASPYSPSSRLFLNTLYLDVEAIDDFGECAAAQALAGSAAFRSRIAALRDAPLVDHVGVTEAKRGVLELLYAHFRDRHVAMRSARAERFARFKDLGGEALRLHALYEALQEHCYAADASAWGWPAWPERFRDPVSTDVARFARAHADRVDFHAYLQWQAALQRRGAAARARDAGLAVGLYADLAVSIDRGGAEAWAEQRLYASGASVGAPPDAFSPAGQDWGLPPLVPSRLVEAGYAPFIATLRANMRDAGALRIDHVMGLMRLFWIPPGRPPAEGAYVLYPFAELLALLALESARHRCLVIGEDLGTVPDEVRRALAEHDVLSYRVLLFERDAAGEFKPPHAYPGASLATASTHDLPTLAGWWEGHDIELRASLGLLASEAERARQQWERGEDRARVLRALRAAGALPQGAGTEPDAYPAMTPALATAILAFLAMSPATLTVVQLEDACGVREQANLPGTVDQHPNWRRKLPLDLDRAFDDAAFRLLVARLRELRRPAAGGGATPA